MQFTYKNMAFKSYEDAQKYYDYLNQNYKTYKECEEYSLNELKKSCSIDDLTTYQYYHDLVIVFTGLRDDFYENVLKNCRKELVIQSAVELQIKKYLGKKIYERYLKKYVASKTH